MLNIYVDVDGVVLRQADSVAGVEPAPHAFEFLRWATEFHRPYWLTTRDSHGGHSGVLRAFRLAMGCAVLPADVESLLTSIRPTTWAGSKIFGIDLTSDFAWVDDEPLRVEVEALQARNLSSRLIVVDSNKDARCLAARHCGDRGAFLGKAPARRERSKETRRARFGRDHHVMAGLPTCRLEPSAASGWLLF